MVSPYSGSTHPIGDQRVAMPSVTANPSKAGLEAEWGDLFRTLTTAFAEGNRDDFLHALDLIGKARESSLYKDLREVSGDLRGALEQFRLDSRLAVLAGKEVPDARVRLDHALKLTEDGAHRTLDLVEKACPLAEHVAREAAALIGPLRSARDNLLDTRADRQAQMASLSNVLARVETFLATAQRKSDQVRGNLTEVLMAQSSQDLSGQIIRGVISLVGEVERTLTQLSALAGQDPECESTQAPQAATSSKGFGPAIPGLTTNAVGEQNDVDALLADLGI
jgi:chemotaxis protein CheZ